MNTTYDKHSHSSRSYDSMINKQDIRIYMQILKFFLHQKYNKKIEKECNEINNRINKDINTIVKEYNINKTKFIYFLLNDINYWIDNILNNDNIDSHMFIFTYNIITYYYDYINLLQKVLN
jgi:hypothetical protein